MMLSFNFINFVNWKTELTNINIQIEVCGNKEGQQGCVQVVSKYVYINFLVNVLVNILFYLFEYLTIVLTYFQVEKTIRRF